MDRKFKFQESQTLGTGLKGICKNLAVSGQPWVLIMIDVTGNHAKSRGILRDNKNINNKNKQTENFDFKNLCLFRPCTLHSV